MQPTIYENETIWMVDSILRAYNVSQDFLEKICSVGIQRTSLRMYECYALHGYHDA